MKNLAVYLILLTFCFAGPVMAGDCGKARELAIQGRALSKVNPAQAEASHRSAITLCPQSASLNFNLAIHYFKENQLELSKEQFKATLKKNPNHGKALNGYAYLVGLTLADEMESAFNHIYHAISLEPGNKDYQDTRDFLVKVAKLQPPKTTISKPHAVAVVIGNGDYQNELVPDVKYAHRDSRLVKAYLEQTMGYRKDNIIYLEDSSKASLEKVFGNSADHHGDLFYFLSQGRADVFIYYSGHGAPDPNTLKTYLLPVDASPTGVRFSGYSMDLLYSNLAKIKEEKEVKTMTLVFESCFSGVSPAGEIVKDASSLGLQIKNKNRHLPENTTVFTSSNGDQISSWDNDQKHGLFTSSFLNIIKEAAQNGQALNSEDIKAKLQDEDGINSYALRNYHRQQNPQVFSNGNLELLSKSK